MASRYKHNNNIKFPNVHNQSNGGNIPHLPTFDEVANRSSSIVGEGSLHAVYVNDAVQIEGRILKLTRNSGISPTKSAKRPSIQKEIQQLVPSSSLDASNEMSAVSLCLKKLDSLASLTLEVTLGGSRQDTESSILNKIPQSLLFLTERCLTLSQLVKKLKEKDINRDSSVPSVTSSDKTEKRCQEVKAEWKGRYDTLDLKYKQSRMEWELKCEKLKLESDQKNSEKEKEIEKLRTINEVITKEKKDFETIVVNIQAEQKASLEKHDILLRDHKNEIEILKLSNNEEKEKNEKNEQMLSKELASQNAIITNLNLELKTEQEKVNNVFANALSYKNLYESLKEQIDKDNEESKERERVLMESMEVTQKANQDEITKLKEQVLLEQLKCLELDQELASSKAALLLKTSRSEPILDESEEESQDERLEKATMDALLESEEMSANLKLEMSDLKVDKSQLQVTCTCLVSYLKEAKNMLSKGSITNPWIDPFELKEMESKLIALGSNCEEELAKCDGMDLNGNGMFSEFNDKLTSLTSLSHSEDKVEDADAVYLATVKASEAADAALEMCQLSHSASIQAYEEETESSRIEYENQLNREKANFEFQVTQLRNEIVQYKKDKLEEEDRYDQMRMKKEEAEANCEMHSFLVSSLQATIRDLASADADTFNDTYEEVLQEELSMMKAAYEKKLKAKDTQVDALRAKMRSLR